MRTHPFDGLLTYATSDVALLPKSFRGEEGASDLLDAEWPEGLHSPLLTLEKSEDIGGVNPEEVKKIMDYVIAVRNAFTKQGYRFRPSNTSIEPGEIPSSYVFHMLKQVPVAELDHELGALKKLCADLLEKKIRLMKL